MEKGFSKRGMSRLALGTHLGDFSKEDSLKYIKAIRFALKNGIACIDGAINYRGMCSEKDEGVAIQELIQKNELKREDFFISSKAGLLFGDIEAKLNPMSYLTKNLEPKGITIDDFTEFQGLYQTLNPAFFEVALEKTLENLGLQTLDVHYIHIPEISRLGMSEEVFYNKIEALFEWYEQKVQEGKIRFYGLALEFMVEEPKEEKWHFELEKCKAIADKVGKGNSHLRYVLFEYNLLCPYGLSENTQRVAGQQVSVAEACHLLGFETVGSMPFAMGEGFEQYTISELLKFALTGVDHVIVGSKNVEHIKEILEITKELEREE